MDIDDTRKAISRVLHDFVLLKLQNNTTLGELYTLLTAKTEELLALLGDEHEELVQIREVLDRANYQPSVDGLKYVLLEQEQARQRLNRIRTALPQGFNTPDLFDGVEALSQVVIRQGTDLKVHEEMLPLLEDAGFSPDEEGLRALVEEHQRIRELVIRHTNKQNMPSLYNTVEYLATKATRMSTALEAIRQRAEGFGS